MAQLIKTEGLDLASLRHSKDLSLWVYNGLDSCITSEVWGAITEHISPEDQVYRFELDLLAPSMEMMRRGVLTDRWTVKKMLADVEKKILHVERILGIVVRGSSEKWDAGINPRSPHQLKTYFYDTLKIPRIYRRTPEGPKLTTDEDALEQILAYQHARVQAKCILKLRELNGYAKVLRSGVDEDSRMRFSFNVAGTETGRWSSSKNIRGGGTNGQNITPDMREIFVPDEGMKFAYFDLEQAESRAVAYISGDEVYRAACESGDLHTAVCRMIWPNLCAWTGDVGKDKELADSLMFDRLLSYRAIAKRAGHATNYNATPKTIAQHLSILPDPAAAFQREYFNEFCGVRKWHHHVAQVLSSEGFITTALGRRRRFFGRPEDGATLREAIAYEPQSTVADILNRGLLEIWRSRLPVQLLIQVHDAVLFQYPEGKEAELFPQIKELMTIKVDYPIGAMVIPIDCKVGFDWRNMAKWPSAAADAQERRSLFNTNILEREIVP